MPCKFCKRLIKRLQAQGVVLPDDAELYLREPSKCTGVSRFYIKTDFDTYTTESSGTAAVSIKQWRSLFQKVMKSPKWTENEKVELLVTLNTEPTS